MEVTCGVNECCFFLCIAESFVFYKVFALRGSHRLPLAQLQHVSGTSFLGVGACSVCVLVEILVNTVLGILFTPSWSRSQGVSGGLIIN